MLFRSYLAVPPTMPDRERLRDEFFVTQLETFAFPNADLQHAIDDLEALSIDIAALERRRDRLVPALREMGYETTLPEGTFYVMARAPLADDQAFARILNRYKVLVLPGVPLVTGGPYQFVRHPNYVGVIGELIGMALITGARVTGPFGVVFFSWLLVRRIRAEERALR